MVFPCFHTIETEYMKVKTTQLIFLTLAFLSLVACTDTANKEDNNLNNNPALDTVDIKIDTINNFPIPLPDSAILSTDSIARL